jgi:hypothetical protein
LGKKIKATASVKSQKQKLNSEGLKFWLSQHLVFHAWVKSRSIKFQKQRFGIFLVPSVVGFSQAVLRTERFCGASLSWFSFLTCCSIFLFLVYPASETWVGALLEKLFFGSFQVSSKMQFNVTRRCSIVSLHWTGFKSHFCGFATQKYSTKIQLKTCR